jgi:hypothetical protein
MSFSIQVYPIALREKTDAAGLGFYQVLEYIEVDEHLIPFTEEQLALIKSHLGKRDYVQTAEYKDRTDFKHKKYPSVSAMLTAGGLFFSARGEDVMEVSMTAGEFEYDYGLKGHFAVFSIDNGGWKKALE